MKTRSKKLVALVLLGLGSALSTASAQSNAAAKDTRFPSNSAATAAFAPPNEVDLRAQYEAALTKTTNGTVPLSTLNDGTKVFLTIQASKPIEIVLMDSGGKRVPISFATAPGGGCRGRFGKKMTSTIRIPCFQMNKH